MKIVGITACVAGIAHTYIAREKLENAARELGHEVKIETQGTIGVENHLTPEEIAAADIVIIAADIKVGGKERFEGVPLIEVPISMVMKNPKSLITQIESKLKEKNK